VNSPYLSKENLIVKTSLYEGKIYLREQQGKIQRIRRSLSTVLMAIFFLIPFINYQGSQAVYIDVQQQQLQLFSLTLFPQDLLIVCLLFIFSAFILFYVTKFYGRVWCGFTCPQTIWMLMFNWVERRVEGSHNQSKALDSQPLHFNKLVKKSVKHLLWGAISLLTALVFMSYFIPVVQLYPSFFTFEASALTMSWVLFFTVCTYINAGWLKDKMCQHMCPYSRFQSAMFDQFTRLVSYDHRRGENRGKRKRSQLKKAEQGDCVDCNLCVQVCPVGIDIRAGLQYECINCGLCVDACNATMDKFNYAQGLIDFTSEQPPKQHWKRHLGYGSCTGVLLLMMWLWLVSWQSVEVNIIRDRQALYRVNQAGNIENTYLLKIRNKSNQIKHYQIATMGLAHATIIGSSTVKVLPLELSLSSIVVTTDEPLTQTRSDIRFRITDIDSGDALEKISAFYSGNDGW